MMVARRFYVARKLEMGLNFSMLIHLLLGASVAPFSFILPQIFEKYKFSVLLFIVMMIFSSHTKNWLLL